MHFLLPNDKEVTDFRARLYEEDFGISASYLSKFQYKSDYDAEFAGHKDLEDIYKYSDIKYLNSGIEQVLMTEDRTMISGGTFFDGEYYRAGHLVYCLKNYRKQNYSWMYQDFGALYGHIKRAIELNIPKVIMCHWPHNSRIRANIENHKRKLIGRHLHYFMQMEHLGAWNVNEVEQEVFVYDIPKRFKEIEKFTMTENILPMGEYETLPVTSKYGNTPEKYGCVVKLNIDPIDHEKIRHDMHTFKETKKHYFQERLDIYKVPPSVAANYLKYVGFSGETYDSTGLNITGTAELDPNIPKSILEAYSKVQSKLFRQNFVVAMNGWNTKWHRDHSTPLMHGFRLMIPIDPVVMYFRTGKVELQPGHYYFVNNSLEHKGSLPDGYERRANLMAQMDSDIDILNGDIIL